MNTDEIFTLKADLYRAFRPQYAKQLVKLLIEKGIIDTNTIVADIGCGTGILAKQIAPYVKKIYGVEPNSNMLNAAVNVLKDNCNFIPIQSYAENTGLSSNSLDLITVGQAFHWFQPALFKKESLRILKRSGYVLLVWNVKEKCEQELKRKKIVEKYRTVLDSYDCDWGKRIEGISSFFNGEFETYSFDNSIRNTYEEFIGRTLSASHAVDYGSSNYREYVNDWKRYFMEYAKNGIITIPNSTVVFLGKI